METICAQRVFKGGTPIANLGFKDHDSSSKIGRRLQNMVGTGSPRNVVGLISFNMISTLATPVFTGANFARVISAPYSGHFLPRHNYPTGGGGEVIIR